MKLIKTASGKKKIKISKSEWQSIGKKAGWMKKAYDVPDPYWHGGPDYKPFTIEDIEEQIKEKIDGIAAYIEFNPWDHPEQLFDFIVSLYVSLESAVEYNDDEVSTEDVEASIMRGIEQYLDGTELDLNRHPDVKDKIHTELKIYW